MTQARVGSKVQRSSSGSRIASGRIQAETIRAREKGRSTLATIQDDILKAFYAKLSKSASIDQATVDALRKLLQSGQKLKADDFVGVLAKGDQP